MVLTCIALAESNDAEGSKDHPLFNRMPGYYIDYFEEKDFETATFCTKGGKEIDVEELLVVGHTDNVGKFEANMLLSKQRADAVVKVLVSKYGITASRLLACGAGSMAPVASNQTEEGRGQNRRVELVEQ